MWKWPQELTTDSAHLGLPNGPLNVIVSVGVSYGVPNANAVSFNHQEVVDHLLNVSIKVTCNIVAKLSCYDVHEGASLVAKSVLGKDPRNQLSMLDDHL